MNSAYILIPAKKQSTRLKNKNLLKINKKSLLQITIESLNKIKNLQNIYISTNSIEISNLANNLGVRYILRKKVNSNKDAPAKKVVADFINQLKLRKNDSIIYLQPTSPLRTVNHIKKAIKIHFKTKKNIISFKKEEKKILKCFIKKKNNLIPLLNNDFYSKNEQSLPNVYMPNGAIYIFKVNDFNKEKNFPTKNVFPFLMSDIESIDIDSIKDLRLVRKIFQKK